MRHLLRLATALLLGGFIGLSTTCSSLDLGGRYYPFAADAPPTTMEVPNAPVEAVPPLG